MKPTTTSHISRSFLKALGYPGIEIDHLGLYARDPVAPLSLMHEPDSHRFRDAWQAYNLLRKREVSGTTQEDVAKARFLAVEERCATKLKLPPVDKMGAAVVLEAIRICQETLGEYTEAWIQRCSFSGGASTSRSRSEAHPALKWAASPPLDVTQHALPFLLKLKQSSSVIDAIWSAPGAMSLQSDHRPKAPLFRLVRGDRYDCVPKNYKTHRSILIQPDGNLVLQKGMGAHIRGRLRRIGINLNDQTRNQRLAFAGSITGRLGTIDVTDASDTVLTWVVFLLCGPRWAEVMWCLATRHYLIDGEWRTLEKFSAMGNGFTFELESLIFYSITQAVVNVLRPSETRVGIFGDDIICASSVCGYLSYILGLFGFSINTEKSFWHGYFRESCGKHYHNGLDCTPVYLRGDLDGSKPETVYVFYNQIRRWTRQNSSLDFDERFITPLDTLLKCLRKEDRIEVPAEYSDDNGLKFCDVCVKRIRLFRDKRDGIDKLQFFARRPTMTDLSDRVCDETKWFYRIVERWEPSCPLGLSEYSPVQLVRAGELQTKRVTIPASAVTLPIR